jgi:glycosyltransferase involved in cell wall biosynthesis
LGDATQSGPELSFVVPVFNGARTISGVVDEIHDLYGDLDLEVILVNDGSGDESEEACRGLQEKYPRTVSFLQLARNFGEHNAVLAGLHHSGGAYVTVLDDDGQNPPGEVRRLYDEIRRIDSDVVYGRYQVKQHSRLRNLGSWLNDKMANVMLGKPPELYLSSFKLMNRFVVDEIKGYTGAFPYIDGLILRTTDNLAQVDVDHRARVGSSSNYTTRKLVSLWLNMLLNFSIMPLRVAAAVGAVTSLASLVLLVAIVLDKLFLNPDLTVGIPTVLVTIVFFAGVQLLILGTVGEYLGRVFLDQSGKPQFVIRYLQPRTRQGE